MSDGPQPGDDPRTVEEMDFLPFDEGADEGGDVTRRADPVDPGRFLYIGKGLTADEFIAWALQQPEGRFELDNGAVVAMAPERMSHARAKSQAWLALRTAIATRGLPCEALPDGATVRVNDRTVYEPDALVRCGPPLPGDAIEATDPIIVVEVVSPDGPDVIVVVGPAAAAPATTTRSTTATPARTRAVRRIAVPY